MTKLLKIRELRIDETEDTGVQAISFVDFPAIETNFEYFAANKEIIRSVSDITDADLNVRYKWILGSETDVCPACIEWAKEKPKTLQKWIETALPRVPIGTSVLNFTTKKGWQGSLSPDHEGPVYNTFCGDACRCYLKAEPNKLEKHFEVELKIENSEKREVVGTVLKSNQLIYRHDVGNGPGYVWFSRDTVRQIMKKFGYNRNVTFQHVQNKLGSVIMMKTWLEEDDKETRWMVKYKVIDNNLWEQIKAGTIRGFSIEASFK